MQETLVVLAEAEETTPGDVTFQVPARMFRQGASKPSLVLQGMITTEVVTLLVGDGAGWTPVFDDQATPVAATLDFDSNKFSITLNTPGLYSVTHTALGAERKLVALY